MRALTFVLLFLTMQITMSAQHRVAIIPEPVSIETLQGSFSLSEKTGLVLFEEGMACRSAAFLKSYLSNYYKLELKEGRKVWSNFIRLEIKSDPSAKEGAYALRVEPEGVTVTGYNEPGLFYGVQTLLQLLPASGRGEMAGEVPFKQGGSHVWELPCVKISDAPRFEYRGMHLDVVRHIFPVEYIKRYLDYLAFHKMNYFHWHLTDDQGWRMESKSHPALNERGAYREGTIIGLFPGTGVDSTRYGGYYTLEQLKEVVAYAADRYITVVPEIDIPGHCMAVLATYPQFGTEPGKPVKPAITWGIFNRQNNVLAPSEEVFQFLEDVYNELMDVFPGPYIHMGADECAHKWWEESPKVQEFIASYGLKDEKGLQRYFAERVSGIIKARGRIAVGWDEMVDNGLIDDVVVMSWRSPNGAYKASAQGHKAILTPLAYSYFNVQQREKDDSICHNSRVVSLDKVYKFEPVPDTLSAARGENVIGGQGCMWTEYFPTTQKVEYGVFPRMSAIAEVYWSDKRVKNWPAFLLKLPVQFNRYDLWGANYSSYIFEYECFPRK